VRRTVLALSVLVGIFLPSLATADQSIEAERFPTLTISNEGVHGQFFAQVLGAREWSSTPRTYGELGVGGRLIIERRLCRQLDLGGQARAMQTLDGQSSFSGEQWLSGCVLAVERSIVPTILAGHRFEWQVHPSLSASPLYWRAPFTRETVDFDLSLLDADVSLFDPDSKARFRFGHAAPYISYLMQREGDAKRARWDVGWDVSMAQWFVPRIGPFGRLDHAVDILRITVKHYEEVDYGANGWSATGVDFTPLSLTATELGAGLLLDARVGWAYGSIDSFARNAPRDPNAPPPKPVLFVGTVGGEASLYGGSERTWGGVRYTRGVVPTLDLGLARDDRLTGWLKHRAGPAEVGGSVFIASTTFWDRTALATTLPTGGADAHFVWSLDEGLSVRVSSELARSYYARLDPTDLAPRPQWALRTLAMLAWSP
jgi:hypothetical protein